MAIQRVHKGDQLKISAVDWNAIAMHVNDSIGVPSEHGGSRLKRVTVCNRTQALLKPGMTVKLTATSYHGANPMNTLVFKAEIPAAGEDFIPAVMASAAKPNFCGEAIVSGIAPVRVSSGTGLFGSPDGSGMLTLSDNGPIQVIPNFKSANWKFALLGGTAGGADAAKGPFDTELKISGSQWTLTCIDTATRLNAGLVHCGSRLEYIATASWTITQATCLWLDISYTPPANDSGQGTYSFMLKTGSNWPASAGQRQVIERIAQVTGNVSNGFTLAKIRTPGDYTVTGRWLA